MPIKYRYAYDDNDQIIDIFSLSKTNFGDRSIFKCVGCDNVLIPVMGEKKIKHFRHKVELNCSLETYLHKLAKITFYDVYNDCLQNGHPFTIEINQQKICNYYQNDFLFICEHSTNKSFYDLTKYFSKISLEKRENQFIPDLLLSNESDKLFVEIAVFHQVTQDKIDSKYRIIEINIKEELDIEIIRSKRLEEGDIIKFFNFRNTIISKFCQGNCINEFKPYSCCEISYLYFIIFSNGKSAIIDITYYELANLKLSKKIKYKVLVDRKKYYRNSKKEYLRLIIESFFNNDGVKNCFLCRYHAENHYSEEAIFCKFLKKRYGSNEAAFCGFYRPDTKVFPSLN